MPPLLWIAIVAVAIALLAMRIFPSRGGPASDPDAQTLSQLQKAGSDLTKPHRPEFFLYLPSEAAAQEVARAVRAMGFSADVRHAATGTDWLCTATKEMILTRDTIAKLHAEFSALLEPFHGQYDGWGAEVVN